MPSLSYDLAALNASGLQASATEADIMQQWVQALEQWFKKIKDALTKPFADVEASYSGLVADMKLLDAQTNNIQKVLGNKTDASLWKGMEQLSKALKIMDGFQEFMSDSWKKTFNLEREQIYCELIKSEMDKMQGRL